MIIIATIPLVILFIVAPYWHYYNAIPSVSNPNITVCSYPIEEELEWVKNFFKFSFSLFRSVLPFSIMIVSSMVVVYVVHKSKTRVSTNQRFEKEIHLFKSLAALDVFFIIFRLPTLVYLYLMPDGENTFTFIFFLCIVSSLVTNVFNFVLLIKFNKVYRELFFQYIKFKSNCQVS